MTAAEDDHDDTEARPWERPGSFRRDCEPHRGQLLWTLAVAGLVAGLLAILCFLPAAVALPLGLYVQRAAAGDLRRIRAWLLDPAGLWPTRHAGECARAAMVFAACAALGWTFIVLIVAWQPP